jgi:hypothetical protein
MRAADIPCGESHAKSSDTFETIRLVCQEARKAEKDSGRRKIFRAEMEGDDRSEAPRYPGVAVLNPDYYGDLLAPLWPHLCSYSSNTRRASQNRPAQRQPMANPYRPETLRETAATNRFQIAILISDLRRSMNILTADIEHEEERAGVRDLQDPAYPVLARTLMARRDNIEATICALQMRVNKAA